MTPREDGAALRLAVHALCRLRLPCPVRLLSRWFGGEGTLPDRLRELPFVRAAGGDAEAITCPELFRWLQAHPLPAAEDPAVASMGDAARALILSACGRQQAGASLLCDLGLRRLTGGEWEEAVLVLRLSLMEMLDMDLTGADAGRLRSWNGIALALMEAFLASSCRRLRPALRLHARLHANASRLGDIRTAIVADLLLGLWFAMRCTSRKRYDALARALTAAESLGDGDMRPLTIACRVIYCATRGDLNTCMRLHGQLRATPGRIGNIYTSTCAAVVSAAAAVLTGSIHEGLAALQRRLDKARQDENRLDEMWLRTQLGNLLCSAGRHGDALRHLDKALRCSSAAFMPMLHAFLFRVLAFYHYCRGAIVQSYQSFRQTVFFPDALIARRSYYGYPWLLELLWEYRRAGLPELPGYALRQAVDRLWDGGNIHLQGAARRFEALLLAETPGQEERRLTLLRQSLADLEKAENQRELALTRRELARLLAATGRKDEARPLRKAAEQFFADASCSQHGLNRAELQSHMESRARALLESCEGCANRMEYFHFFLLSLQRAFQCERSALFRIQPCGDLHAVADNNFETCRNAAFIDGLRALPDRLEPRGCAFFEREKSLVCLPVFREERYLAYADNLYLESVLPQLGEQGRERLCWMFTTHFSLALGLLRAEAADRRAQREAPEREDETDENIYWEHIPAPVRDMAGRAARANVPVLLLGETGVGKEVLARYLHRQSGRRGRFVAIQPSSMTESLFESALFGHEKGAFTGALQQKIGLIEAAHGGTLFIDEVGDIPLSMQVKLLRVLQEKTFMRVGGIREQRSDFRIIGATHRDLAQMAREGRFREDLYYRLAVIPIAIPPLRGNAALIAALARKFAAYYARRHQVPFPGLDENALARLCAHAWPGNIRELKNFVERMVILSRDGAPDLVLRGRPEERRGGMEDLAADLPTMETLRERYIRRVLELTRNRVCGPDGAEGILGMKRSTLYAALRRYGIGRR